MAIIPTSIIKWRVVIGTFSVRIYIRSKSNALVQLKPLFYTIARISIMLLSIFLLLCGEVELSPEPNKNINSWFNFSILSLNVLYWINSLTAYNSVNKLI